MAREFPGHFLSENVLASADYMPRAPSAHDGEAAEALTVKTAASQRANAVLTPDCGRVSNVWVLMGIS
jgi:hypothetical protein